MKNDNNLNFLGSQKDSNYYLENSLDSSYFQENCPSVIKSECNALELNKLFCLYTNVEEMFNSCNSFNESKSTFNNKASTYSKHESILTDLQQFVKVENGIAQQEDIRYFTENYGRVRSTEFLVTYNFDKFLMTDSLYDYFLKVFKPHFLEVTANDTVYKIYMKYNKEHSFGTAKSLIIQNVYPKIECVNYSTFVQQTMNATRKTTQRDYIRNLENIEVMDKEFLVKKRNRKIQNVVLLNSNLNDLVNSGEIDMLKVSSIIINKKLLCSMNDLNFYNKKTLTVGDRIPSNWFGLQFPVESTNVKLRHYWLYSTQPNKGKTTFLNYLAKTYKCYYYNLNETFQDNFNPETEVVLIDEFIRIKESILRTICDGTCQFSRKGLPAVTCKTKLVFVASNYPISYFYQDTQYLSVRFHEINLDTYLLCSHMKNMLKLDEQ